MKTYCLVHHVPFLFTKAYLFKAESLVGLTEYTVASALKIERRALEEFHIGEVQNEPVVLENQAGEARP